MARQLVAAFGERAGRVLQLHQLVAGNKGHHLADRKKTRHQTLLPAEVAQRDRGALEIGRVQGRNLGAERRTHLPGGRGGDRPEQGQAKGQNSAASLIGDLRT